MKITVSVLLAMAAAEPVVRIDRKVPPKHPRNRLARLNLFCDYLFNKTLWIKESRTGGLLRLCNKWAEVMERKIDSKCFWYDSEQKPHGGPEPGVDPEPPKKYHDDWDTGQVQWIPDERRRRRNVDDSCWQENPYFNNALYPGDPAQVQTCDTARDDYMHPDFFNAEIMASFENELCEDDCADNNDCGGNECAQIERGSGDKKIARLMKQGPWKGARSILTGFRKFGERYMANCHGHRSGSHMNKRTQFIVRVSRKYLTHCDHEQCNRAYLEDKKFKWGKKNLRTDYAGK